MFGLMLQKMWHKKWMNICLLLGCTLLIATVVSFPIYKAGAYNRMLNDEFNNYIEEQGSYPAYYYVMINSRKDKGGSTISRIESLMPTLYSDFNVTERETILYYFLESSEVRSSINRSDSNGIMVRLATLSNVEDHASIIAGESLSETGLNEDGAIEVLISQSCMVSKGLLIGETLTFSSLTDIDGNPISIYIKGVFDKADSNDLYWKFSPESMTDVVLMNTDLYHEMFTGDNAGKYNMTCNYYGQFEYEDIDADNVEHILERDKYYREESPYKSVIKKTPYTEILEDYLVKQTRIAETLNILQVPVLVMLAAFLIMISAQMYEMEKNEISVIKSRGSSGRQIFLLYLLQGLLITLCGCAIGLPLGRLFAELLGSTRNFLEFNFDELLKVRFTKESMIYLAASALVCLLCIILPSIKHSRVTIVNLKQSKALRKKPLWEKLFLDVILLGVSLYGYYSFKKNAQVAVSVMSGESLDPLLYISSSLFILGAGLFFLRIQPYIVRLIYLAGKKFWKPASHVSFMENIKNGKKQQLIMLFLIMTISLGIYHATVARTILDNAINNTDYLTGADVIIKEVWNTIVDTEGTSTSEYIVPDYSKYASMDFADKYTKVIDDNSAFFYSGKNDREVITLLGVQTKEFGQVTDLDRSLTEKHYYSYLNDLATSEKGVILSTNFNTVQGFEVGDYITLYNTKGKPVSLTVVGFMDYMPGYLPSEVAVNADGTAYVKNNYFAICQYSYLSQKIGTYPYEVWIKMKDGYTSSDVYNWIKENDLSVSKYVNKENNLEETMQDPLLQGTNGILTMSFIVTIILCAVGYLIYWIMSIKERELMFGILRASGFHKGEIFHLLINEQVFCGVFSILAGIGIGNITTRLFVPILDEAFASEDQAIPLKIITDASDMIRLYGVVAAIMLAAVLVLVILVLKMNITKALKLGEE